jgi:hypothetical protein
MITRTVEQHADGGGSYWLASGPAYGRMILAEGETRSEASLSWVRSAAERQAKIQAMEIRGRRVL